MSAIGKFVFNLQYKCEPAFMSYQIPNFRSLTSEHKKNLFSNFNVMHNRNVNQVTKFDHGFADRTEVKNQVFDYFY